MKGGVPGHENAVFQDAMAAHQRSVGENAVVADHTVMGDVGVGHEEIVVADAHDPRLGCAAVNRHMLAEDIVVADFNPRRFVIVFEMLRPFAQHCMTIHRVVAAHAQRTDDVDAGAQGAAVANLHFALNDYIGADDDFLADHDFRVEEGGGMDASGL